MKFLGINPHISKDPDATNAATAVRFVCAVVVPTSFPDKS